MSNPAPYFGAPGPAAGALDGTGGAYLAQTLAACGTDHFFHVPVIAPNAIRAMQALGVRPIVAHTEKAAAYMADGYARASGRLGVCGAQAIGAANLAAGLADAAMARSPVLALTGGGSAGTRERNTYQEYDQRPIYSGLTKMSARVEQASRLPDLLGQAVRAAMSGAPGPAHLELAGFMGGIIDGELAGPTPLPEPKYAAYPVFRHAAPPEDIEAAARALAAAKRPMVIAGSGVRAGRAAPALGRFCRALSLPLAVSLDAKAVLPESDPLSVGVVGVYSRETANMAVSEADFVLFVGTTTGSMVTAEWSVPRPGVAAVQIDVDPRELGRNYPLVAGLAGDPATVLGQLETAATPQPDRAAWLERISSLRSQWTRSAAAAETSAQSPIRPERLCRSLSEALPDDALVVVDTGYAAAWAARHIYLDRPGQGLLRAAGSLGWSYPAALGAKCAQPQRPVVCFTGDGGFLYHLGEMETAVRYGINTVTVVNNNDGYGQEQTIWGDVADLAHNWRFSRVSYADAARAFGCKAYRVEHPDDLTTTLQAAFRDDAPVVVEVMSDVHALAPPPWKP